MSIDPRGEDGDGFLPARYNRRVFNWFMLVVRRKFRRSFHGVRLAPGTRALLEDLGTSEGPLIIAMNHVSWWDPLTGLLLHDRFLPRHQTSAPMDSTQLVKFGFFRKLGIFGISPDEPRSLERMSRWIDERFSEEPRTAFWLYPQGRFEDVREPVRPRPGMAAIAAEHPQARVASLSAEYTFWTDSRPELCLRGVEIAPPEKSSTSQWHRRIKHAMQANAEELATLVRTRDPDRFESLGSTSATRLHPMYDLWLRLRGTTRDLDLSHRSDSTP